MGRAIAVILAEQLSASVTIYPYPADDLSAARRSGAARVLQGYFEKRGDQFDLHAVVEDLATVRNVDVVDIHATGQPLSVAPGTIAKQIDKRTRPFGSNSAKALSDWGQAISASDPGRKAALLEDAIKADPNFGAAYVELAQNFASSGDRQRALDVAKRADERLSEFTDLDRARMELVESALRQNPTQRREALMAMSRLVSTDANAIRAVAETELARRRYDSAVYMYRNALAIEPDNAALLNELGYAQSYAGNLNGARDALERYRRLQPNAVNPLDSLGEVHFFAGRFGDAANYFLEARKSDSQPQTLREVLKAAEARYMEGNLEAADALFRQFETGTGGPANPMASLRRAQWLYVTGRENEAIPLATAAAESPNTEIAAYAQCHLALWALDSGDLSRGSDLAARALNRAQGAVVKRMATVLERASQATTDAPPGEMDAGIAQLAQAYGAVFHKRFSQAVQLWKAIYEKTAAQNDGEARTLYAWSLIASGDRQAARPLLDRYFIPLGGSDDALFSTSAFRRFVQLRSQLFGSAGK